MPFDNPYFPTEFDVGTVNGPHIHMDSAGLDVTDGAGDHIKMVPQSSQTVPAIEWSFLRDAIYNYISAILYAVVSSDGKGTQVNLQANAAPLQAGIVQSVISLAAQASPRSQIQLVSDLILLINTPQSTSIQWDGLTAAVQGVVNAQQLQESPGVAWTSYTPGFTNFSLGNGTVDAAYRKLGKLCEVSISITAGSTTTNSATGTAPATVSLPFTAKRAEALAGFTRVPTGQVCTACGGILSGAAQVLMIAGTQALTNAYPFGLGAGQQFVFTGSYETT